MSDFLHTLDKFSELPKTLDNWCVFHFIFHFFICREFPNSKEKHTLLGKYHFDLGIV